MTRSETRAPTMVEVQRTATHILGRVLSGRSLDAELRAAALREAHFTSQQRAAVQDIAYGTLRFLGELDAMLDVLLERPLKDKRARELLRVALFQIMHTRAAPHAIVDHAVRACAVLEIPAAKGLVNAVLRNALRNRESTLALARRSDLGRYSHPTWWIDKVKAQYPADYDAVLDQANTHPPLTLRVNRRRLSVEAYTERLHALDIAARPLGGSAVMLERPVPVERIPGFTEGDVSVQDAAAQYAAPLLALEPGLRVLDA
ncbi:MAG TPA: transcription antitermination factor NusB, partial [Burkholderiales bacterium]|nr:transcription antitermination factor NusB [Burkholderiales bacterium]